MISSITRWAMPAWRRKSSKSNSAFGVKGIFHIAVEIDSHQTTAVVGQSGNLAARVGRHGLEAEVGVTVGN